MEAELMPVVNPADLAAVFNVYRDLPSHGGVWVVHSVLPERLRQTQQDFRLLVEALCSPGADIEAISRRAVFLHLLLTLDDGHPMKRIAMPRCRFPGQP